MRQIDETPFYFEHRGSSLYAMLHTPVAPAPARLGVVVCPPFADEAFRTHRELVVLARRLAAAGIAVLRFDYRGTGESGGAFEDFGLEDWRTDIGRAIEVLEQRAGVHDIALVGLRLGAALAAATAETDPRVQRLVLCAPLDPPDCARELDKAIRTQQLIQHGRVTERTTIAEQLERGESVEVGGYPLTERLHSELTTTQPWSQARWSGKALILGIRRDTTKQSTLESIQRQYEGAELHVLEDPRFWFQKVYRAPEELYRRTTDWLTATASQPTSERSAPPAAEASTDHSESPVAFTSNGLTLHGVLHTPASMPYGRQGVIVFHGGRQARRGPHRLYVKLARRLCDAGLFVLRYDNRGYGDSEGEEQRVFDEWQEDAVCATRFFREHANLDHVWGWGLCAGALLGVRTATAIPEPFAGFVFCNALLERALNRSSPHQLGEPLWRRAAAYPVREARRLRKRVTNLLARPQTTTSFEQRFDDSMVDPLADFPRLLAELARPSLLIFGDIDPLVANYEDAIFSHPAWRQSPHRNSVEIAVIPGADHNFIRLAHENAALDETERWLLTRAAAAVSRPSRAV